jgi:D-amino peptidase
VQVFISADIEGVTGIAHWDEANRDHSAYAWFRERMNVEVAAACDGALLGGATDVMVKDAHGSGRNLLPDRLPRPTRLVRGWSGHPHHMVQGLERGFSAVAFVGYHSPCGSGGHPLSHTFTGRYARVELNGERLSELRCNSWIARSLGVPTVFVSGDEGICAEARAMDPDIVTVASGHGEGHSTVGEHPEVVEELIRAGMAKAVRESSRRPALPLPTGFELEVRFRVHHDAYRAGFYPGAVRVDDDRVTLRTADYTDVLRALLFW